MPAVFTDLQAPSLLKAKSARGSIALGVHKSPINIIISEALLKNQEIKELLLLMLKYLEFEFSNVSLQPLQLNLKLCCNEMIRLVVVVRKTKSKQKNPIRFTRIISDAQLQLLGVSGNGGGG